MPRRSLELASKILRAAGGTTDSRLLMSAMLEQTREWTRCEAAAIRLEEGGDYRYAAEQGFPPGYLDADDPLLSRGPDGQVLLDARGRPALECACGLIARGATPRDHPTFTSFGSFWIDSISERRDDPREPPPPVELRGHYAERGYESLACIPLRYSGEIFGILRLNSKHKHRITAEVMSVLEPAMAIVSAALKESLVAEFARASEVLSGTVFGAMKEAFAFCRVLADASGQPADFVFVAANQAYCGLFSLPDPVGRRLSEIDPEGRLTRAGIVETCARVLSTGIPQREEIHHTHLDKWLDVRVIRPAKDHVLTVFEDITERKRGELALRLKQLSLDNIADYPVWLDREGRILDVSEATVRHLEYSREELLSMTIFDLDPDLTPDEQRERWRGMEDAGALVIERTHRAKSGRTIPVEISINYISDGAEEYHCGMCRDISLRKRLEESLELTQFSVDRAPVAICWLDTEGRFVYVNDAYCDLTDYAREELQTMHVWDVDPDLTPELWTDTYRLIEEANPLYHEARIMAKDGDEHALEISSASATLGGRELFISFVRDVTERKRAEESLRESEGRYRRLFDLESDALLLTDDESLEIIEANEAAAALYGHTRDDLAGMRITDISAEPDETLRAAREKILDIPLRWHRRKDGTVFPVDIRKSRFEWKGRPVHLAVLRDITERRRFEESLRLTQFSVDQAPDLIHWMDYEGHIVYANKATCEVLGYSEEELLATRIWDIHPGGDRAEFVKRWERTLQTGPRIHEEVFLTRDGRELLMEVSSGIVEQHGKGLAVAFARDITERRQAERSLRESEERYRQLFEVESDAIVVVADDDRSILEVNDAATHLYGYSRDELLGMRDLELLAPVDEVDDPAVPGDMDSGLAWHRRKNGAVFPVETRDRHFVLRGRVVHVTAIRDITERRRAGDDLAESRQMLQMVLDTVPLRISWKGRDLRYMGCNSALAIEAGLPDSAAIVGLSDEDLPWGTMDRLSEEIDCEVMETGLPRLRYEETVSRSGGDPRTMRSSRVPLRDRSGNTIGLLSVQEDITERMETLEALRERDEQLRQSQKMEAIGRLAGGIAHDFNNVLTTIIGYGDLILSSLGAEQASLAEDVGEIKAAAVRAGELTKQILAFSRRQALEPKVLSLNTVIAETERLLGRTLGADMALKTSLSPDISPVEVDEHQFVQVLLNLAVNARDAMPQGGQLALATRDVHLDERFCETHPDARPGDYVLLEVTDTGVGMDVETMAHAFEPFFTTKAPGEGTGLGLATVYGVVAQSGGHIYLDSAPGRGTSFHIYLPRYDASGAAEESQRPGGSEADITVLVIEDDITFRNLAVRFLERAGYKTVAVSDGDEALAVLRDLDTRVDLLLADMVLPGSIQGEHVAAAASGLRPGLPVVYTSVHPRAHMMSSGRVDDQVEYLEKPFTSEELTDRVRKGLRSRPFDPLSETREHDA